MHGFGLRCVFQRSFFCFYTLFDLLPKMLFRLYPNRLCIVACASISVDPILLRPLVWLVEGFLRLLLRWRGGKVFTGHLFGNREELRFIMQESAQALTTEERAMINRVLDLQSLTVRQVTVPLDAVISATARTPVSESLDVCANARVTRCRSGKRAMASDASAD